MDARVCKVISRMKGCPGQAPSLADLAREVNLSPSRLHSLFKRATGLPPARYLKQATCDILTLELGPLDLDLLGLQVHLDGVVLEITAQAGPGDLLGTSCAQSPACSTRAGP